MMVVFAKVFNTIMNMLYSICKVRKTKDQVVFISRQSEVPSLDFQYIIDELNSNYPDIKVVVLCKMIPNGIIGKLMYCFEMLKQMKELAVSKVAVIDGYCILVSILNHKSDLKVIQIWHALGSFKRFGKSILDMDGGKSSKVAEAFKMHNNYDYIATSGDECVKHFSEAFGQPSNKFIPMGIPRMDYLTNIEESNSIKKLIYDKYPRLNNGKKTILYVPTFRDNEEGIASLKDATKALVESIDFTLFNLVVKHHVVDGNNEEIYIDNDIKKYDGQLFTGMNFMSIASYVITDYSSIIYEAILKDLPIYIYCFDSDKYLDERGFYIDFWNDIPAIYSSIAIELSNKIKNNEIADLSKIDTFKKKYVNKKYKSITHEYGKFINELVNGTYDNRYNYKYEN